LHAFPLVLKKPSHLHTHTHTHPRTHSHTHMTHIHTQVSYHDAHKCETNDNRPPT